MSQNIPMATRHITAANNPFAQQRLEQLTYRFPDGLGWESNLSRLHALNHRACIVGVRGTGKSTLLHEMHRRLSSDAPHSPPQSLLIDIARRTSIADRYGCTRREQVASLRSQLAGTGPQTWILVDGLERLSHRDAWCLTRRWTSPANCAGLVVTMHRHHPLLRLPQWIRTQPTAELLVALLTELGVNDNHWHQRARQLWSTACRRSIREVFRRLYDEYRLVASSTTVRT